MVHQNPIKIVILEFHPRIKEVLDDLVTFQICKQTLKPMKMNPNYPLL